jgi:hypothetical protein
MDKSTQTEIKEACKQQYKILIQPLLEKPGMPSHLTDLKNFWSLLTFLISGAIAGDGCEESKETVSKILVVQETPWRCVVIKRLELVRKGFVYFMTCYQLCPGKFSFKEVDSFLLNMET